MTLDDPVTLAERYARATSSSHLAPGGEGRTDLDMMIAAGLAVTKTRPKPGEEAPRVNHNWVNALRVLRLIATEDMNDVHLIVEHYDGLLNGHLARKGNRPMPKPARRSLIVAVLQWKVHLRCDACGGAGKLAEDGEPGRGKMMLTCDACHGAGIKPLSRAVPQAHGRQAQWLVDTIDQHSREAIKQMRLLLNGPPTS